VDCANVVFALALNAFQSAAILSSKKAVRSAKSSVPCRHICLYVL
jgi:hypothetical protein